MVLPLAWILGPIRCLPRATLFFRLDHLKGDGVVVVVVVIVVMVVVVVMMVVIMWWWW